ncbi:hypothetical protein AALP_AA6G152600 [Arabis alpina]|nr:hypothetical protein AALP_AA6G152600 [Arabis alpina]
MEHPRSFRNLAPRTTGSGKPPTPTTSAASTTVPTPIAPAPSAPTTTTTTAKGSRLSSVTRSDFVTALPAPLPSDYDAKRAAKGNEDNDCKRLSDRDDVSASSLFSTLAFSDAVVAPINTKSSREMMRQGLKFLAFVNKVGHELEVEVEDFKKQIETKNKKLIDKAKKIATLKAEAQKSAAALLAEAEKSVTALAVGKEREQYSAATVKKRDGELSRVVDRLRRADEQIQSFKRKFGRAKDKFDELQGDLLNNMVYQVQRVANLDFASLLLGLVDGHEPPKLEDELTSLTADVAEHGGDEERFEQLLKSLHELLHVLDPKVKEPAVVAHDRTLETYTARVGVVDPSGLYFPGRSYGAGSRKATVVRVDGKFSLVGRFGAEVTKTRIEDVAEGSGTVGAPEQMRMDEDSKGPRNDALTEDLRLDDDFGETEAEGALVAKIVPPGVDEETVP